MTLKILFLFLGLSSLTPVTWASLGGTLDSIDTDNRVLKGQVRVTRKQAYTVHEITTEARKVREFVGPDGKVFAVSWRGSAPPDLRAIFGDYFNEYKEARSSSQPSLKRGSRITRSDKLVVEETGHMRDLRGKAYIPQLVPEGTDIEEIR